MLISVYMQKNHLIYIILFMIINIISELVNKQLKQLNKDKMFYYLIDYICEIFLIFFYIIEQYLSKNENEEYNEKNQISIKVISLIICYLIFNAISIYCLKTNSEVIFIIIKRII